MPAIQRKKVYSPLTDGLNDSVAAVLLRDGEAAELLNCEINERSILEKYKGYTKDHSPFPAVTDSFIRLLLNYRRGTSVDDLLMLAQDNGNTNTNFKVDIKKTSGDGTSSYIGHTTGTAVVATGTDTIVTGTGTSWSSHLKAGDKFKRTADADTKYIEIQSVDTDTQLTLKASYTGTLDGGATAYIARIIIHKDFIPRGAVFNNKAIITNGSDTPMIWNNTTLDLITDAQAPKAKYIEPHKSRVFFSSTSGAPSDIFWSATNDVTSHDAAANEPIFPQDNGNIISIKSFGDSLIVLKNNGKIYQVIGNFDQTDVGKVDFIRKLDAPENIGAIPERSPVVHQGFLYFLAETGIYRIDQRMFVEKVTFNPDNFIDSISFSLGPTQAKSYPIGTKVEWDDGTHDGTRVLGTDTKLKNYFDEFTINDAFNAPSGGGACWIDTNNDLHVVYIHTNSDTIKHITYLASDNSSTTETVATDAAIGVSNLSMAIASNGNIGVSWISKSGTHSLKYAEKSGSSWGSIETVATSDSALSFVGNPALAFTATNSPRIVNTFSSLASAFGLRYHTRATGSWVTKNIDVNGNSSTPRCSIILDATDKAFVSSLNTDVNGVPQEVNGYSSVDDGTTWVNDDLLLDTDWDTGDMIQVQLNSSGEFISVYGSKTDTVKRNHTTGTSTVIDASNGNFIGYQILSDKDNIYYTTGTSPNHKEKYIFETSSNIEDTLTNQIQAEVTVGHPTFHHNGSVFCSLAAVTATSLKVRRVTFKGTYTSKEFSDSTLTAWGTYDVSGQTDNSATVLHEVATRTISPPNTFKTISDGQIIESDAAKIFVKNRITNTLGGFATPEISSVVMNYTGAGIDSKQAEAISFNNELFFALAEKTASNNNRLLISDIRDKLLKTTHPVSSLEVYKNKLYGGLSTKGDLIVLKQGFNFDGVAYSSDFQSKEDFLEAIELEKDVYKFYLLYETQSLGSFDFSYRLNNFASASDVAWTSTTVDQTKDGIKEILVGNKARSIQWRIENKNLDEQLGAIAVVLVYGILNIR